LQNKSGTTGASTNYVLSNDLGTDSSYYGEFGMNSSVFSSGTPSDFFSINNGVYFSGHDGDITFGSGNGYKSYFAWGATGASAHVINTSGAIGLSTNLGTTPALSGTTGFGTAGQVMISNGSGAANTWSSTPTLIGTNFTGIPNGALTNSSITFGATAAALGSTVSAFNAISIGATTASTGAFTTLSASSTVSGVGFSNYLAAPPAIGSTTANTGAFTTLSASSTISGVGFSNYLAAPPAIGGTTPAAITGTTITANTQFSGAGTGLTGTAAGLSIGGNAATATTATNISGIAAVANGGSGSSSLTANSVMLGNGTAALSGNMVAPGASGNVLTSNGTTWTSAAASATGLGYGQTWQNVSGSRAANTTYTNSTGKPIFVYMEAGGSSSWVNINGTQTQTFPAFSAITLVIPNGNTYSIQTVNSGVFWMELR